MHEAFKRTNKLLNIDDRILLWYLWGGHVNISYHSIFSLGSLNYSALQKIFLKVLTSDLTILLSLYHRIRGGGYHSNLYTEFWKRILLAMSHAKLQLSSFPIFSIFLSCIAQIKSSVLLRSAFLERCKSHHHELWDKDVKQFWVHS